MEIKCIGHACFLLTDNVGTKILLDPFDPNVGYKVYDEDADIITVSHHHRDHDYTEIVKGDPYIIDKEGTYDLHNISFRGIPSFHDKDNGAKRGKNTIFIFNIDGYKICHLGDLGYVLSDEEVKNIGEVNVLMIPVGGFYTIDAKEAAQVSLKINSNYIIPMHYKKSAADLPITGVDLFINEMGDFEKVGDTIKLERELKGHNKVKVME